MKLVKPSFRVLLSLVVLLSLSLSMAPARHAQAAPTTPKIAWSPCYRELGFPFECGTVQVPLDYGDHSAGTVSLAVVRLPAADPANKIGSLFFNPGGPGGSGVDLILFAGPYMYTPEVRNRFDLVGFDPRGIARSTALRCFGNPKQWAGYFTPFVFPMTLEEDAIWEAADAYLVDACEQRGTKIIDYMSTGNTARDLDMLRQAVGDEQLNYAGFSYGTFLGQVYANLFPDKVRAVIIDAVVDPIAWTTGAPGEQHLPFSTRLRSDVGAMDTLNEFFRLCDENPATCAFSGDAAGRFAALGESLKAAPLEALLPDGSIFYLDYSGLISNALGAMYNPFSWPDFAAFLAAVEQMAAPALVGEKLQAFWVSSGLITKRGFPQYPNYIEGFPGVACADSDNPDYSAWWDAAVAAEAANGYFGRIWTYIGSICSDWPSVQNGRYIGPFDQATANPVLVVGNYFDPATRYQGAQIAADLLPNSRLLSLNGWGHASIFLSQCIDGYVEDYLVNGALPPEGTVCLPDLVPFVDFGLSSAGEALSARHSLTHIVLPDVVKKAARGR